MKNQSPYTINTSQKRGRPREHSMSAFEIVCDQRTAKGLALTKPVIHKPLLFGRDTIYIDGEWHLDTNPKKFYLLGYAFDNSNYGWLYNQNDYKYDQKIKAKPPVKGYDGLSKKSLEELFNGVKTIYFYGPDAGMIESMYHIRLKDRFRCVNLLKVAKMVIPKADMWKATLDLIHEGVLEKDKYSESNPCYRLCAVEHLLGIVRETIEYKKDVDNLHRDWYTPHLRAKALLYNKEDVINLIRLQRKLYWRYNIPRDIEDKCMLQITKADKEKFKSRK